VATVSWTSDRPDVATVVASGLSATVTAVGRGNATITARADADTTKRAIVAVNVLGVASVTINANAPVTLDRGSNQTLTATAQVDAGISNTVAWTSRNPLVATVTAAGLVRAINPGSAYVVVSAVAEPGKRDSSKVTVPDPCATPAALTLGATVNGAITIADCTFGTADIYQVTATTATLFSMTLSQTAASNMSVWPFYQTIPPGGEVNVGSSSGAGSTFSVYVLAPATSFLARVTAFDTTQRGTYTLTSAVNPVLPACPTISSGYGVTHAFTLGTACGTYVPSGLVGTFYQQTFFIGLPAAKALRVTATAAGYPARLELKDFATGFPILATAAAAGPGSPAILTFTRATGSGATLLMVTSQTPGGLGAFTLTIDP